MRKVLIVHNNYGKYSGEEAVVDKMAEMLSREGYDVAFYRRTTEGARESLAGRAAGFFSGLWSPAGVRGMREALRREKPDVVNVHNLYPFISPAALFECRKAGVPVVMTVHNFRLICPTGLFMRDGRPCEFCLERGNEWGCIRHNCEHSFLKSLGYAARNAVARWTGAYRDCVDRFACITDFQRRKLIEAGFPPERITVIPNCIDIPHACEDSAQERNAAIDSSGPTVRQGAVAYLGRLSPEKGFDLLLEVARRHPEIEFRFAGAAREGELSGIPDNVRMAGYLRGAELEKFLEDCAFIVMPSRCYEGFPIVILEAAAHSRPAVGPDHGGFTEIIGKGDGAIGRLFTPGDIASLEEEIVKLWRSPDDVALLGARARKKLEEQYSSEAVGRRWRQLLDGLAGDRIPESLPGGRA